MCSMFVNASIKGSCSNVSIIVNVMIVAFKPKAMSSCSVEIIVPCFASITFFASDSIADRSASGESGIIFILTPASLVM